MTFLSSMVDSALITGASSSVPTSDQVPELMNAISFRAFTAATRMPCRATQARLQAPSIMTSPFNPQTPALPSGPGAGLRFGAVAPGGK